MKKHFLKRHIHQTELLNKKININYNGLKRPKIYLKRPPQINPEVVTWIKQNYMEYSEGNIPKNSIYNDYLQMCTKKGIVPAKINIFTKYLKQVYPNIVNRRLGPRKHGIPHYGGIVKRILVVSDREIFCS
jgi:hypothetical protein